MHLGKLCKYYGECPVYKNENKSLNKPVYIVRNVFCNRGEKGWKNCKRHKLYEKGLEVENSITPFDK
jgi:hypothetical protein